MPRKELEKIYNPKDFEERIYQNWEEKGYFTPQIDENKTPYTIVIPPPNITGQLHMGHAVDNTLQDILIRGDECRVIAPSGCPVPTTLLSRPKRRSLRQCAKKG